MTERLYYTDSYMREFTARIVERSADGLTLYLDRTAFYPASGGQPFDTGAIAGARVVDVVDEDGRIAHRVASPIASDTAPCAVDWTRRFDHMQQHTGQHVLSAVLEEAFGLRTVGFHMGSEVSTVDLEGGALEAASMRQAERRANEIVCENRPVAVRFQNSAEAAGLRKPSERAGELRIVCIEGLDRSACGGTHVRATGEIGAILLRKPEKVRQATRVEFLCGARAVARARADFDALAQVAHLFSAPLDDAAALVAAQLESARGAEKARRKLELELAGFQGRELYAATAPGPDGIRRVVRSAERGSLEELRAIAQSFTAQSKAVFLATLAEPPSVLLAASEDSGTDAGRALKAALAACGGRGGGNARLAQGSVPEKGLIERAIGNL